LREGNRALLVFLSWRIGFHQARRMLFVLVDGTSNAPIQAAKQAFSGGEGDGLQSLRENRKRNSYFQWNLVALVRFMRLSLTERRTRGPVQCSVAGNPGTLRSG